MHRALLLALAALWTFVAALPLGPTPAPVAARRRRHGLGRRADDAASISITPGSPCEKECNPLLQGLVTCLGKNDIVGCVCADSAMPGEYDTCEACAIKNVSDDIAKLIEEHGNLSVSCPSGGAASGATNTKTNTKTHTKEDDDDTTSQRGDDTSLTPGGDNTSLSDNYNSASGAGPVDTDCAPADCDNYGDKGPPPSATDRAGAGGFGTATGGGADGRAPPSQTGDGGVVAGPSVGAPEPTPATGAGDGTGGDIYGDPDDVPDSAARAGVSLLLLVGAGLAVLHNVL